MSSKPVIKEMALDTRVILNKFRELSIGDELKYSELSGLIGRDVRKDAYQNFHSARRAALSEGIVIGTVHKVGIRRLDDRAIVRTSGSAIEHIHRTAKKSAKTLSCVRDYAALDNEHKIKHNSSMSMLGVLAHISSARTHRKIESRVQQAGASLPLKRTLEELA